MEDVSRTEPYRRGIPMLAFLPILALLAGKLLAVARSPHEGKIPSPTDRRESSVPNRVEEEEERE
jgi:hypothetical protein